MRNIVGKLAGGLARPGAFVRWLRNRCLPQRVLAADLEAYQAVTSWTYGSAPRLAPDAVFPGVEAVDVEVPRAFDRIPGISISTTEVLVLAALVRVLRPKRILEIGTSNGHTTINLAANSPADARVVSVDLPPDWQGGFGLKVSDGMVNVTSRQRVGELCADARYAAKIRQVFGDSATLDWTTLGGPFDLVYIDGCHDYEYVRSDTGRALGVLGHDGVVVWHDYGMIEEVSRAVDEAASQFRVVAIRSTRFAVGFPRQPAVAAPSRCSPTPTVNGEKSMVLPRDSREP